MSRLQVLQLPRPWMIVLDVVAWAVWSATAGLVAHRMPVSRLDHDNWWFRLRPAERSGRLYERLRIKRWKDRLPEAGALFTGGFSKRRIATRDPGYLERFVVETRRAELTHWLVMAAAPLFFLWNYWWVGLIMIGYALIANLPCLAAQRYNRVRLLRILARRRPASHR